MTNTNRCDIIIDLTNASIIDLTNSHDFIEVDRCEVAIELNCDDIASSILPISRKRENNNRKKPSKTKKVSPNKIEKHRKRTSSGFGDCPICFDKLGNNPLASTKCGHVYCLKCLEQSLKQRKKCPTCRCSLKGASAYHPLYLGQQ